MSQAGGIAVAYSGVHQAYQLALAAHEEGELQRFYCSFYDGPGKWGGMLSRFLGSDKLANRRVEGLPAVKALENPWPLLAKSVRDRFKPQLVGHFVAANDAFDRWVARHLEKQPPRVFVGTDSCDLHSLEVSRRVGARRVHDCPQLHPLFLERLLEEAGQKAGIKSRAPSEPPEMIERKLVEYDLAEKLLIYSEVHRRSFLAAGLPEDRLVQHPLWLDPTFWYRDYAVQSSDPARPLRLFFVGSMTLRKGIPFLLDAVRKCGKAVELTVVGTPSAECDHLLKTAGDQVRILPPQTKAELRQTYSRHDLFVLPSVADSFGFVALEAMACGLPVIVTDNCGAPVPESAWRVPPMNAEALAARIMLYADDRNLLAHDAGVALAFVGQFTPASYRENIRSLYRTLLGL